MSHSSILVEPEEGGLGNLIYSLAVKSRAEVTTWACNWLLRAVVQPCTSSFKNKAYNFPSGHAKWKPVRVAEKDPDAGKRPCMLGKIEGRRKGL